MSDSSTIFVDLDNAREPEQRAVMEEIIASGKCPFCQENFTPSAEQPILKQGKYWWLTPNRWPYKNTKLQILAISNTHAEKLSELDPAAGQELLELLAELEREHQVPGGGVALRFGDTNYSAGSVKHLHAQFIVPDIEKPEFTSVRIKIGKSPSV